jgi:hypothetical protein
MVAPIVYGVLFLWAKRIGRFSRLQFWELGRMKDRYESQPLNMLAIGLSLTAAPIGSVLFGLGIFSAFGTDHENLIALAGGLSLVLVREIDIVACDMFAKRTLTVA